MNSNPLSLLHLFPPPPKKKETNLKERAGKLFYLEEKNKF